MTAGLTTSTTAADAQITTAPPTQVETALEMPMLVSVTGVPMQPLIVQPIRSVALYTCRLNDKIYSTIKGLFSHVNVVSNKEVLPKIDTCNSTIVQYI